MATIKFVQFDGTEEAVEAENGTSLMNAAFDNGIAGIDADCGGECSCATCHVLVDEAWLSKLAPITEQEDSMLDLNPDRATNSRLSCQIPVSDEISGIVIQMPEFQY
ncbi:MAG: 2Fe-2S iron-sulfur cluster-binding protein [Pseudomonadales bacterium]|jgi:2Fe-2S ferredoxin|tara:strand:+ start:20912 stop:21232 length:321 start_codon:yes stop_codon:yes gene_type:complete